VSGTPAQRFEAKRTASREQVDIGRVVDHIEAEQRVERRLAYPIGRGAGR